ncbi:MAG: hypothetical protein IPQ07_17700 [Myxococcales bacterium]|nr:hypothetical protein [Myxococcales bacterium]
MNRFGRSVVRGLGALALIAGVGVWVVACKQGEGDRCQVNADCESGLVCNQATQSCAKTSGGGIDADVPDGPPADAPDDVIDAMPDAMIDAI